MNPHYFYLPIIWLKVAQKTGNGHINILFEKDKEYYGSGINFCRDLIKILKVISVHILVHHDAYSIMSAKFCPEISRSYSLKLFLGRKTYYVTISV